MNLLKLTCILFVILIVACSSAKIRNEHILHHMYLYNLHWRRPNVPGANPKAERISQNLDFLSNSEEAIDGYYREPRPDERFDCRPLKDLFVGLNLNAIRQCFQEVNESAQSLTFRFLLRYDDGPYLNPEDIDQVPECIREHLKRVNLPREIFYQSNEEGPLNCYSSEMKIRTDEFSTVRAFLNPHYVEVSFPIPVLPETDAETVGILGSWVGALFLQEDGQSVVAKIVPSNICGKCMSGTKQLRPSQVFPPAWPNAMPSALPK